MEERFSHQSTESLMRENTGITSSIEKGFSRVVNNSRKYCVTDTAIQNLVGIATYRLLYLATPDLYTKFYSCTAEYPNYKNKTISTVADFQYLFIDSNYTPQDLKLDLVRICSGLEPINPEVAKLVGSSTSNPSLNISGWDWLILIFLMVIIAISLSWLIFDRDASGPALFPRKILKMDIWKTT